MAAVLALAVGAICLLARALRLGVLASFLSRPILTGFFIGISLSILVGQIGRFTGVQIEADGLIRPFVELARKAGSIHWPSVALAFAMLAVLQGVKAARFPVPGPLVVVVLAVAALGRLRLPRPRHRGGRRHPHPAAELRHPVARRAAARQPCSSGPARSSRSASAPASSPPAASAPARAPRWSRTAS